MSKLTVKSYVYIVLLAVSVLLTTACSSQAPVETPQNTPQEKVSVSVNKAEKLDEGIVAALEKFGYKYGTLLTTLENQDFSRIFIDDTLRAEWERGLETHLNIFWQYAGIGRRNTYKNQAAYDTLAAVRKLSGKNLAAESANITYNVDTVKTAGDLVVVYITEDNVQKFSFMDRNSCSANINHRFAFMNTEEGWKIAGHLQEEDFFLLALEAWDEAAGADNKLKAENTVEILIADAQENIDELATEPGAEPIETDIDTTEYNREDAVKYAEKWWDERNYTGVYLAYDDVGGNCQNFASQCIHAGGMKMDHSGYIQHQWKFYDKKINERWIASGRSYSWTGVDTFYHYAKENTDGMICQADLKLKYAQKGDVIQVGAYHRWRHSLVVTDVLYDGNGALQEIVVASNTADRWNYPLSAYIYTYPRLIHIIGEN